MNITDKEIKLRPGAKEFLAAEGGENRSPNGVTEQEELKKCLLKLKKASVTTLALQKKPIKSKDPLIDDWMREGDIGFIYATRGTGKTWFALDMAKAVAKHQTLGAWKSHGSVPVLYIDGEVAANDMKNRCRLLEADSDKLTYLNHELLFDEGDGAVVDLGSEKYQQAIQLYCEELKIKVLFLDNLSCLAPTIDENEGIAWSENLLQWTLWFRRKNMSIVFVQHAGRNGQMRGHSRREDPANWIIKLTEAWQSGDERIGAKFYARFDKNRNAAKWPNPYEFHYSPNGDALLCTHKEADDYSLFLKLVKEGEIHNADISEALGIQKWQTSRLSRRAARDEYIVIKKGKYYWGKNDV
jgi:hypothetical protein